MKTKSENRCGKCCTCLGVTVKMTRCGYVTVSTLVDGKPSKPCLRLQNEARRKSEFR